MDETEVAAEVKTSARAVDRATLGKEEGEKVSAWLRQLSESSGGFLQLSRSDVVNFLIREHKADLSSREIQQIRTQNYDPIKHLNWITPRLKEALQNHDMAAVVQLQSEIKSIELSVISKASRPSVPIDGGNSNTLTKPKPRRAKKADSVAPPERLPLAELQTEELPEG